MYRYDAIGNLVQDQAEGTKITWTPYGKVRTVSAQSDTVVTTFRYDGAGNRIEKRVVTNDTLAAITHYLRDASGNVMAIYQDSTLQEQPIYGSARLGQYQGGARPACLTLGMRRYELSNHLGNVLTVITDNIGMSADTTWATVVSASDYYPFGLTMEGRNYQDSLYRYGFNGKEKDQEGEWGSTNYDYGFRIYSPAIARFLSVDPLFQSYPWLSTYQFAQNDPIRNIDIDGLEGGSAIEYWLTGLGKQVEAWWNSLDLPSFSSGNSKSEVPTKPAQPVKDDLSKPTLKKVTAKELTLTVKNGIVENKFMKHDRIERLERRKRTESVDAIILHRTAGGTQKSAIDWWKNLDNTGRFGTPFIIDREGNVTQTASLDQVTFHTRSGEVEVNNETVVITNDNSIGIEIVGNFDKTAKKWDALTKKQIEAVRDLVERIKNEYDLTDDDIFSHYQVNPKGKSLNEGNEAVEKVKEKDKVNKGDEN